MELGRIDVKQLSVNSGRVTDESFSVNLSEVSGPARRARGEIEAVRRRFEGDMRILRAVRAYDPSADVKLAELAYVVLTYDDGIMDGKAPLDFTVTRTTTAAARQ